MNLIYHSVKMNTRISRLSLQTIYRCLRSTCLAYDDSNYSLDGADYNSEFTGPSSSGEKRRPNKNKNPFTEAAVEDSSVAFGDGGNDYGVEDISFGDYGGFEDYGGFNSVEAAPAAPAAPAAATAV